MSLLGIDIGTTVCKAAVFTTDGRQLASASREYPTQHAQPGYSELDSADVWRKTREVIAEVAARTTADPITALCVSSLGEAVTPVSRDGAILGSSILSSDTRGAEYARRLGEEFSAEACYRINPNPLGPHYALPKLLWLRDHQPALFHQADYFLLWGDLVGFLLGGDPVANLSLANRTLLLDIDKEDWSEPLLAWSGINPGTLGRVAPCGAVVGVVADRQAAELGLPRGVRIVTGGHDQACNALGCGGILPGRAICGIGTFESITPIFRKVREPLAMLAQGLNIEHHILPELYVAFLYNQAGALVRWFRDTFAAGETGGSDLYARLNAEMPAEPTRLLVLPHFDPPQWPRFIADTAGVILGLHTDTTRGEILKAIMESVTLYFLDGVQQLGQIGIDLTEFIASGGGAASDAWLQIKADIFGIPFVRPRLTEGGVLGAAMLAGLATGVYAAPADAVDIFVRKDRAFEPDARRHAMYQEKHAQFRQLAPTLAPLLARM